MTDKNPTNKGGAVLETRMHQSRFVAPFSHSENSERKDNEAFQDYFVRLFENKNIYGLNCVEIAELLNFESGEEKGEAAWRKEFAAFNRGRIYERGRGESGIATRILSISDTHVPFHLPVETFNDYIGCVDILQLNGDVLDCQSISKFSKTYRISMIEEMILARQYIIDLVEYVKPKRVSINFGNHEIRFQNYLSKNLGDSDVLELMPETALDLICTDGFNHYDKRSKTKTWYEPLAKVFENIEFEYTGDWWSRIGNAIFCHPFTFSGGIMKTVEKAMNFFLTKKDRDFDTVVMSHTHQLGDYKKGDIQLFEQGACCQTDKMNYADGKLYNPQHKGFLYLCQDKDGNLIKDKTKLIYLD